MRHLCACYESGWYSDFCTLIVAMRRCKPNFAITQYVDTCLIRRYVKVNSHGAHGLRLGDSDKPIALFVSNVHNYEQRTRSKHAKNCPLRIFIISIFFIVGR